MFHVDVLAACSGEAGGGRGVLEDGWQRLDRPEDVVHCALGESEVQ